MLTKKINLRLQFTLASPERQMIGKKTSALISLDFSCDILVVGSEFGINIMKNMDPPCLESTVQANNGGVMLWGKFSWHILGHLMPAEQHLNATALVL